MKSKILLLGGLMAAGLMFNSCNDQLDIHKKGNLGDIDTYYTNDANVESGITAAYSVWGFELFELQNLFDNLSDDMWTGAGGSTDYAELQTLNAYTFGSDNPSVKARFTHLYTLIYDANLIIDNVPKNETQTDVMKRDISEAYFFRGWAELYLGAAWGNVPIVDHVLASGEYAEANNTQAEVLQQAVKDLQTAANGNLPSKKSKNDPVKRITKEAALAFLGKAYLQAGDYSNAATTLDQVINSGLYDLEPKSKYGDILKPATQDGPEVIACRYIANTTVTQDWVAHQGMNNYYSDGVERGWRNNAFDWTTASASSDTINVMEPGYGECSPRMSLYNDMRSWELQNGGDLSRLNNTIKTFAWTKTQNLNIGQGYVFWGNEGLWNWKNRFLKEEVISDYGYGGWNVWVNMQWRAMRYAEVLLMAAEANLQTGNSAKALQYLNLVRVRAGEQPAASVDLNMIKNEKRFELCFEGCRWLDLVRWGDAYDVLKDQGKVVKGLKEDGTVYDAGQHATAGLVKGKNELLPIPETEMIVNPNIKQNPGWSAGSTDNAE